MQDELDPLIEQEPHDDDGGKKSEVTVLVRSPLSHENHPLCTSVLPSSLGPLSTVQFQIPEAIPDDTFVSEKR